MSANPRNGRFSKVKDNLYRYSATKTYYAVYRRQGKLRWKSLRTQDRELAERRLRDELAGADHVDVRQESMTLEALLSMFEEGIKKYDTRTQRNRRSILAGVGLAEAAHSRARPGRAVRRRVAAEAWPDFRDRP